MAQKYYPRLWSEVRIRALLAAGRLSEAEAAGILGEEAEEAAHDEFDEITADEMETGDVETE